MPTTYEELLYAAMSNATRGLNPSESMAADALSIADTLFPVVSQAVSENAAANEYKRSFLRREKSITLVAGEATLTDDVLNRYVADAVLIDPAVLTKHYAWRDYPDFVRRGDTRLGVFTIQGGMTLSVIEPNAAYTDPLTATGTRTLFIPCQVVKPATATTDVDAPDVVISDLIEALAEALKGQLVTTAGEAT